MADRDCEIKNKDSQIHRSCRGNTEPPALVRYAQNNGEEIVQSHDDCEIVN